LTDCIIEYIEYKICIKMFISTIAWVYQWKAIINKRKCAYRMHIFFDEFINDGDYKWLGWKC
jgi:hypothetical protein